ncbi:unnamed protein product, partial [Prorocentrum cordatum]
VPLHDAAGPAATGGGLTVEHHPPHHGADGPGWSSMPRLQTTVSGHWQDVQVPSHEDAASFLGLRGAHGVSAADVSSAHHGGGGHPEHSSFCGGAGAAPGGSHEGEGPHAEQRPGPPADAGHGLEPDAAASGSGGGGGGARTRPSTARLSKTWTQRWRRTSSTPKKRLPKRPGRTRRRRRGP